MVEFLPQSVVEDSLLSCSQEDGVTVASIGCQTIREWQAAMIRQRLEAAMDAGKGKVALCLAGVTGVSSAFIRDLIRLTDRGTAMGGRLALFGLSPELDSLLHVAGFDARLTIADSRDEAIGVITGESAVLRRPRFFERLMGRKAA